MDKSIPISDTAARISDENTYDFTEICMTIKMLSLSVLSDSLQPMDFSLPAPLTMGFPRLAYWSGYSIPFSRGFPNPGTEPGSPTLQADSLLSEPPSSAFIGSSHNSNLEENCNLKLQRL